MAKEGMTIEEIEKKISHLKDANKKVQYLSSLSDRKHSGIIYWPEGKGDEYKNLKRDRNREHKKALLKPETKKAVNELLSKYYLEAAENFAEKGKGYEAAMYYRNAEIKDKETLIKAANKLSKTKSYSAAAEFYEKARMKDKAKENYICEGDAFANTCWTGNAIYFYEKAGMKKEDAQERVQKINEKSNAHKTIDSIVTSILAFGGIGLLFSLFSQPGVITLEQAAPPFPNYMPYIFLAMLIGGTAYFLIKKFKK